MELLTDAPDPPRHLDREAARHFSRLCEIAIAGPGLIAAEVHLVELAAECYARWVDASRRVAELGQVIEIETEAGTKCVANPAAAEAHKNREGYRKLLIDLRLVRRKADDDRDSSTTKNDDPLSDLRVVG